MEADTLQGPLPEARELELALVTMNIVAARRILQSDAPDMDPLSRVERLIVPALERIGDGWNEGRLSLSQVYMAGRLCESIVDTLLPPGSADRQGIPILAVAVLEDYHMLGLRVVYSALRAAGYEVRNYGRGTVDEIVERVRDDRVDVLLVSVLMLPSALRVKDLVAGLRQAGLAAKVIVGGAPFRLDPALVEEVGADAAGNTAADAIRLVRRYAGEVEP